MTMMYVAVSHFEEEYHGEHETVLGIFSSYEEAVKAVIPSFEFFREYETELRIKEVPVGMTSLAGLFEYHTITREDYKKYL